MMEHYITDLYLDEDGAFLAELVDGGGARGAGVAGADEDEGPAAAVEAGLGHETADVAGSAHDEGRAGRGARRTLLSQARRHCCCLAFLFS